MRPVAALCISPRGPYPDLLDPDDLWDERRDAMTYSRDWAVVAHPPCGPWGRLSHMCHRQDARVGLACVDHVRRCGGVLEHPAFSKLWDRCGMSKPGEFPDAFGGITLSTTLAAFGAPVKKPTWIYVVGSSIMRTPARETKITRTVESLHSSDRQLTPIAMARYLIEIARKTKRRRR